MRNIYHYRIDGQHTLSDGTIINFDKQLLGPIMTYWWNYDKCRFSQIYDTLYTEPIFQQFRMNVEGIKTRKFTRDPRLKDSKLFSSDN